MRNQPLHPIALAIALAILPLSTISARAQVGCFGPSLTGEYTGGEMHLELALINYGGGFYSTHCWTGVAGVDVYRRTVGSQCGPEVLIASGLAWTNAPLFGQSYVYAEIVDASVEANTAYEYTARAVGAAGNDDAVLGYVSTGPSLICRGTLSQSPDCGISMLSWVTTCITDCFSFAYLGSYPSQAAPYFNTSTTLLVYGEFDGVLTGICNASFPLLNITSVEEAPCTVGVSTSTWGAVKALYR